MKIQWVARYHMDVFIKIKIGSPLEEPIFYFKPHKNGMTNYRIKN